LAQIANISSDKLQDQFSFEGEVGRSDAVTAIFSHILALHLSPGLTQFGRLYQDVTVIEK
jgi:hypothetical protein